MNPLLSAALGLVVGVGVSFAAFGSKPDHDGMAHVDLVGDPGNATEATQAYQAAAARMHQAMNISYSGDADIDFVRGMIPHHQAAIEMARIVLDHGADSDIRILAEAVINAQAAEIDEMTDWLDANDK